MSFDVNRNGKIGIIEKQTKHVNLLLRENSILLTRSWFACLLFFIGVTFSPIQTNWKEIRFTIHSEIHLQRYHFPPNIPSKLMSIFFKSKRKRTHTYIYIHTHRHRHTHHINTLKKVKHAHRTQTLHWLFAAKQIHLIHVYYAILLTVVLFSCYCCCCC